MSKAAAKVIMSFLLISCSCMVKTKISPEDAESARQIALKNCVYNAQGYKGTHRTIGTSVLSEFDIVPSSDSSIDTSLGCLCGELAQQLAVVVTLKLNLA